MTTNIDLDPQVLAAAKELAESSGRTVGQVISELASKGLGMDKQPHKVVIRKDERTGFPVACIEPPVEPIDPKVVRRELEENGF